MSILPKHVLNEMREMQHERRIQAEYSWRVFCTWQTGALCEVTLVACCDISWRNL